MTDIGFVLVHGGMHGSWCWQRLQPLLDHPAVAVDLPGRKGERLADLSVGDFVAAASEAVCSAPFRRVILVGHSAAGVTIPSVAEREPQRIASLVFVSCAIPAEGECILDSVPVGVRILLRASRRQERNLMLPRAVMRRVFCNDMDKVDTRFVLERVAPEARGILTHRVSRRGVSGSLPRTFVRLTRDRAIPPRFQDRMITNLGGARIAEIHAGHDVMISQPAQLAAVLNDVASALG